VGRGSVAMLDAVIGERATAAPHFDWNQLARLWSSLAHLSLDERQYPITQFAQLCTAGCNLVAATSHYGRLRFDVVEGSREGDAQMILALLVFRASAPLLPVALGNVFVFGTLLLPRSRTAFALCTTCAT